MVCNRRGKRSLWPCVAVVYCLVLCQPSWAHARRGALDRTIRSGFAALRAKRWMRARVRFELALRLRDQAFGSVAEPNAQLETDLREQLRSYWLSMNGQQSLLEFACFSAQLEGKDELAEEYFNKVEAMRGPLWGRSWEECVRRTHRIFFANLRSARGPRFGKALTLAGRLLLDIRAPNGMAVLKRARRIAPREPAVHNAIASYLLTHRDPGGAKRSARASLALKPDQPAVLIDLATAEWMLARLDAASSAARKATTLDPLLPGPHGILALVALERGDVVSAVREAEIGNNLSEQHPFFRTILAICLVASGDEFQAKKNMSAAWPNGPPSDEQLRGLLLRRKPLQYARQLR